jgi:hypothetical protein
MNAIFPLLCRGIALRDELIERKPMIGYIVPRSELRGVNGAVSQTQINSVDGITTGGSGGAYFRLRGCACTA